jgi:hypothetical protein
MWASLWKTIILSMWKVRIDRLDHLGIYNAEVNKHTHKLRVIKDYIKKPIIKSDRFFQNKVLLHFCF